MRLVIDMQGAQAANGKRGIGRLAIALCKAMVRQRGKDQIILFLNGLFPESIETLRVDFHDILPRDHIKIWDAVGPLNQLNRANDGRRAAAELSREAFIAGLAPDAVLVMSLFESGDDAVTSIGALPASYTTAVMLHDLIPLIHRDIYLQNPDVERGYLEKMAHLKNADLLLANSRSTGREAIDHLGFAPERVVTIGAACDARFRPMAIDPATKDRLAQCYQLLRPPIMYTGGIDPRKNIEGLIRAYAKLPTAIRAAHQLVIVCHAEPPDQLRLQALAADHGLAAEDLVITGYVPEEDLVALYNFCALFVFPSWHEGFGLPVLEAMACGRAVIAGNTSSLPEVIGRGDILFDPRDDESMARMMEEVLTNDVLRADLERYGPRQAAKFSWEKTARIALDALGTLADGWRPPAATPRATRPRLAYISPMPPAQTGVATYGAKLLPALASHYEIDVIIAQDDVTDEWVNAHCGVHNLGWFEKHAGRYERVLYHFGNSEYHAHMFALLAAFPGVVMLHDFFLSGIIAHQELQGQAPRAWRQALGASHGWHALRARAEAGQIAETIWNYPCNLDVIQSSFGIVVHSQYSCALARHWHGPAAAEGWVVVPHLYQPVSRESGVDARRRLGFTADDFIICSFGHLGPAKFNHRLLKIFAASPLGRDARCHLIFVGKNDDTDYGREIAAGVAAAQTAGRIEISDWMDADRFALWLRAADLGVQLRTLSRGETSGTIFDCLGHGLATIVNANGSNNEIPREAVWMLDDAFSDAELADALLTLWRDPVRRRELGSRGREIVEARHRPDHCAALYADAIEGFYAKAARGLPAVVAAVGSLSPPLAAADQIHLAGSLAKNFPPRPRRRQLLIDISELVQRDAKSGIQRVVRALLQEYLLNPPMEFAVRPVYATETEEGYRHATNFVATFLNIPIPQENDEPVDAWPDDIFLGLDLQPKIVHAQEGFLRGWHRRGVWLVFVVYDLLAVLSPEYFFDGALDTYRRWLATISHFDGVICISRAVATQFKNLPVDFLPNAKTPMPIDWFHLGADIESSVPFKHPAGRDPLVQSMKHCSSFLMIGTIEARKGHAQTLAAFDELWAQGAAVNLVIIGKAGWLVETFMARLRAHPALNRTLFWRENIGDDFLEDIYKAATGLILASHGEGFGLPLIEAARHGLPIIARDLPVFREIAGDNAYYFTGGEPASLAAAIHRWLTLRENDLVPSSHKISWLTWRQSAAQLLRVLLATRDAPDDAPYVLEQSEDDDVGDFDVMHSRLSPPQSRTG